MLTVVDWITEKIAVGDYVDAKEHETDVHANLCLKSECCDESNTSVDELCVPLIDGPGNRAEDIEAAKRFIHDVVSCDEKVLVHCHAGRSRSICIVAAYLMKYENYTRAQALSHIRGRKEIYLSQGIEEIFDQM